MITLWHAGRKFVSRSNEMFSAVYMNVYKAVGSGGGGLGGGLESPNNFYLYKAEQNTQTRKVRTHATHATSMFLTRCSVQSRSTRSQTSNL